MRFFRSLCVVSLLFCLTGCKEESNPLLPNNPPEIVPLRVGNYWAFSVTLFDTTGTPFLSTTDTISVRRDSVIGDRQWFILKENGTEYLYRNDSTGLFLDLFLQADVMRFKYPAAVGDSFRFATNVSHVRVTSIDSSVSVPAGIFLCYVYETIGPPASPFIGGTRSVQYISPGAGFVKKEFFQSTTVSKTLYLYSRVELHTLSLK